MMVRNCHTILWLNRSTLKCLAGFIGGSSGWSTVKLRDSLNYAQLNNQALDTGMKYRPTNNGLRGQ